MCKVYNEIGCLKDIKSHLYSHGLYEYNSVKELINFQSNYPHLRQEIISNHVLSIEHEKITLDNELASLDVLIKQKRFEIKRHLYYKVKNLKQHINHLSSKYLSGVSKIINFFKIAVTNLKIGYYKLFFNIKTQLSTHTLAKIHHEKRNRFLHIDSNFQDAVLESGSAQIQELDKKKKVIDQINSSIYGALGEQKVIKKLSELSDDYILINDYRCSFSPAIYNKQENDHIQSIQVDHILVAPSGVFVIETKNWSAQSLANTNFYSPISQVKRTNFALYIMLSGKISKWNFFLNRHHWGNRKIPIRNLVVFVNNKPSNHFQYVKVLSIDQLLSYVRYFEPCFSTDETKKIADYLLNQTFN